MDFLYNTVMKYRHLVFFTSCAHFSKFIKKVTSMEMEYFSSKLKNVIALIMFW